MTENEFFKRYTYNPETDILGSGGFGSVYRAYDQVEKRFVAIKISQVKDIFGKFTLLNEVEVSKSIDDHPNVARYEFGLRMMVPFPADYAVMGYYEEGNLDMLLKRRHGILQSTEYREIVGGILEGIAHLHGENVIHRDLKLANILLSKTKQGQWRPKIADFGLSRQTEGYDVSLSNSAIGLTIPYAAPEQIENKPIRKNVDLWAFGVVLYRLLTGEMPFNAPQSIDSTSANLVISQKIISSELPEKLNTIAEPYQQIIRRCWVKDNTKRAQTANELLFILRGLSVENESSNPAKDELTQIMEAPMPSRNGRTAPSVSKAYSSADTIIESPKESPDSLKNGVKKGISLGLGALLLLALLFFVLKPNNETVSETTKTADSTEDNATFKRTQLSGTLTDYKKYIEQFPNGKNIKAAQDSVQKRQLRFNNLLTDADVFISINEFDLAKNNLKIAAEICPNDTAIDNRLALIKK